MSLVRVALLLSALSSLLASCIFFGSLDEDRMKELDQAPADSTLTGTWLADSFSYDLVREHYGDSLPILSLEFLQQGGMRFDNAPDLIATPDGRPLNGSIGTLNGSWRVERDGGTWCLELSYGPCEMFRSGARKNALLRSMDGQPVIIMFIGDPDQGDRLLFRKQKPDPPATTPHGPTVFLPLEYDNTFPFNKARRIEIFSYPVRYTWDTVRIDGETHINNELIDGKGRVTLPKKRIKDHIVLDQSQTRRLFSVFCNEPCPEEDKMVAACYDPRHAIIFFDDKGLAFAHVEVCLSCLQTRSTEGIPIQDFCLAKVNALQQLFKDCGAKYFGGPEDW